MSATIMQRILPIAGLAFVFALGAGGVAAQDTPEVAAAPVPGWTFLPGVTLATVYDSNVALRNVAPGTSPEDAVLLMIDPSGSLRYVGKFTQLSTGYRGRFRRYKDLRQLDGYDQRFVLDFEHQPTRHLTFFAKNSYAVVPTTDELDIGTLPFVRAGSRSDRASGGFTAVLSPHTQLSARYDLTSIVFDRADLPGGWLQGVGGDVTRQIGTHLRAGGETGLHYAELKGGTRSLRFIDVGGVIIYDLSASTQMSVSSGLATLNDRLTGQTDQGPYIRGSIAKMSEYIATGVSFERSFVPTFGFGGSARSQELRGWVNVPRIAPRTLTSAAIMWRRTAPLEVLTLQLDTIQARATVGYAVARPARVQVYYAFTRQDSIVTGGEINRSRVGVELVLSQPMRIK